MQSKMLNNLIIGRECVRNVLDYVPCHPSGWKHDALIGLFSWYIWKGYLRYLKWRILRCKSSCRRTRDGVKSFFFEKTTAHLLFWEGDSSREIASPIPLGWDRPYGHCCLKAITGWAVLVQETTHIREYCASCALSIPTLLIRIANETAIFVAFGLICLKMNPPPPISPSSYCFFFLIVTT